MFRTRIGLPLIVLLIGAALAAFGLGSAEPSRCRHQPVAADLPPKDPDAPGLRFYALGDTGTGDAVQAAVAAALAGVQADFSAELALLLGDNFYPRGVRSTADRQWNTKFEGMYDPDRLDIPFYSVLGNHDYRRNEQAQMVYSLEHPESRWRMPDRYYTFGRTLRDGTSVSFFGIDTNTIEDDAAQLFWLESALSFSTADWKILFAHHPLYSNGHYGNDAGRIEVLEELLLRGGVDLYLSGHEHDLQILKPEKGVSYMISGAGGRTRDVGCGENTVYAAGIPGFLAFEISRNRLNTFVVLADGSIDYLYTIEK